MRGLGKRVCALEKLHCAKKVFILYDLYASDKKAAKQHAWEVYLQAGRDPQVSAIFIGIRSLTNDF